MGLQVALIDKSEIVKKMLSHSLHYFGASVHRFETLEDFPQEAAFDLVFIDWDMKVGERPLALMARAQIQQTPIVILHQNSGDSQLKQFPHIKKPMDANLIRELTTQLVPKVNQLKIHKFLKYPATAVNFEEKHSDLQNEKQPDSMSDSLDLPELSPGEMDAIQKKEEPSLRNNSLPFSEDKEGKTTEESVLDDKSPDEEIVLQEIKDNTKTVNFSEEIPSTKEMPEKIPELSVNNEIQLEESTYLENIQTDSKKDNTDFQYHKETQLVDSAALQEKSSSVEEALNNEIVESEAFVTVSKSKANVLEKDNLNLDENTQNDLGPATLINTDQNFSGEDINKVTLDKYKESKGFKDLIQNIVKESGYQILRESIVQNNRGFIEQMLKEYSQTLEFEKVLSDVLKEHGKEKIRNLITTDSKNIVEKSITTYVESGHFKSLMESALKSVIKESFKNQMQDSFGNLLKKEILLTAKQVIEAEIKTLLDEAEDL